MQNTTQNTRENYQRLRQKAELQMSNAISINGGIELITHDGDIITDILIANTKGLYAIIDNEILKIDAIVQSLENGCVMAQTKEYGLLGFNFDFTGSKEACYKYLYKEEESNKIKVAELLSNQMDRMEKKRAIKKQQSK